MVLHFVGTFSIAKQKYSRRPRKLPTMFASFLYFKHFPFYYTKSIRNEYWFRKSYCIFVSEFKIWPTHTVHSPKVNTQFTEKSTFFALRSHALFFSCRFLLCKHWILNLHGFRLNLLLSHFSIRGFSVRNWTLMKINVKYKMNGYILSLKRLWCVVIYIDNAMHTAPHPTTCVHCACYMIFTCQRALRTSVKSYSVPYNHMHAK